jgi:hypothetical protein
MARWLLSLILIFAALASGTESLANTKTETVLSDPAVNTVTSVGVQPSVEDGPYAFFSDSEQQLQIKWLCETGVVEKTQPITEAIAPVCAYPREITLHHNQTFEPLLRYQTDTVAVISDIHGQYDLMKKLLSAHAVVNADANWSFGQGHLVVIGDVMDRGDKVTEILWWLYQLEQQAEAAGGKVHLLLGNHETMVLYNDLRYINKKYQLVAEKFGVGYSSLFSENSVLGQWLRNKPVLAQINDMLFVHGGLHPDYLALGMSMAEVNEQFRLSLGIPRDKLKEVPVLNFLYGSLGPLWYRGYFRPEQAITEPLLSQLLTTLNVNRIVVGHTSMDGVYSHFAGRVISIDSNIKRGKTGEMMFWQHGKLTRGTISGEKLPMRSLPNTANPAN